MKTRLTVFQKQDITKVVRRCFFPYIHDASFEEEVSRELVNIIERDFDMVKSYIRERIKAQHRLRDTAAEIEAQESRDE